MKTQSKTWLISFGDLLTLLLCFIIAAVFQSAQEQKQKNLKYQIVTQVSESKKGLREADGKQIASKEVTDSPHLALVLVGDDFNPTYADLSESGVSQINKFAEATEGNLEIGICNIGFDFSESAFEKIMQQVSSRNYKLTIGAEVCKNLVVLKNKQIKEAVILTAIEKRIMAEEKEAKTEKDSEANAAPSKKKNKKVLFIILGLVLVLVAIGVPLAIFLSKGKKDESKSGEVVQVDVSKTKDDGHKLATEAEEELEDGEELLGAIAPLDPFVVNLKGGRFIRLQLQMEFVERDVPNRVSQRAALIRDAIITLLTTKTADEVLERDGKERLRKDVRALINEVLRKELVKKIYFTQFVVQ